MTEGEILRGLVQDAVETFGPGQPAFLTGSVLVSEWVGEDGEPWLTFVTCDATGARLASWRVRGLVMDVLETLQTREIVKNLQDDEE